MNATTSGTVATRVVSGFKEKILSRRRHQEGQLLRLQNGWSLRVYEDFIQEGVCRRRRVQKYLGSLRDLPTKRSAQNEADAYRALVNRSTANLRTTQSFREAAPLWIDKCSKRKRKPMKLSTLRNWESILDNHVLPVLGDMLLSEVENGAMKTLVEKLTEKRLSPQTIKNITQVVKLVKASVVDQNGNELYPTKWNHAFIDMPVVDETKQRKPSFNGEQVAEIVKAACGRIQMAVILLAATGLRAGELLGLQVRHFDGSALKIEQEVWSGKVLPPKTPNAIRVVDLAPEAAELLKQFIGDRAAGFVFQTSSGKPVSQTNLLKREFHPLLATLQISKRGFHCFRRFRNTLLRKSACPDGLLKFWMGHAGRDMTDRYDRVREDVEFRKDVARAMGCGFELPKVLAPKLRKPCKKHSGVIGRQEEGAIVLTV